VLILDAADVLRDTIECDGPVRRAKTIGMPDEPTISAKSTTVANFDFGGVVHRLDAFC